MGGGGGGRTPGRCGDRILGTALAFFGHGPKERPVHPDVVRELGVEGEAPYRARAYPDHLIADPGDRTGVRADPEDARGPDEYPGERPAPDPLHAHGPFERFSLGSVVVPSNPDVEDPERRRVDSSGAGREVAGEQDEAGARPQYRESLREPMGDRGPQT